MPVSQYRVCVQVSQMDGVGRVQLQTHGSLQPPRAALCPEGGSYTADIQSKLIPVVVLINNGVIR